MNKRAWAEVDLDAIAHNIKQIRNITNPHAKIMAVVKADAYGHGFLEVAKTLIENGADALAVAVLQEAKQLRSRGIKVPILILGATDQAAAEDLIDFDVMPTVFDYEMAKALSYEAQRKDKIAKIHIKIDTGMSRVGYLAIEETIDKTVEEILKIANLPYLEIDGIFSHFSTADETDQTFTDVQFSRFMNLCDRLEKAGLSIPTKHICNSAATIMRPEMHLDMVRPGIILYGLYPSDEVDKKRLPLIPAMSLKAQISMVKTVSKGTEVSYGKTYITDKTTKIATVPIGYADGYLRVLAEKAKMLCHGEQVKVIGRICMDQCMIDVTNVNTISTGDEVTIFGADTITADDVAKWMNTINYEVVCVIGKRIPRIYKSGGRAVKVLNYLL